MKNAIPLTLSFLVGAVGLAHADDVRDLPLQGWSLAELLEMRTDIDEELHRRGVMRSSNQLTGELAEYLFARAFGWTLARNSQKSYDALHDGIRYQIKARRDYGQSGGRQLSAIRDPEGFDHLAVMIFDKHYRVSVATIVPASVVIEEAHFVEYTNSYRFVFSDDLLALPGVRDVTKRLRE